jgi:hypothetical protein
VSGWGDVAAHRNGQDTRDYPERNETWSDVAADRNRRDIHDHGDVRRSVWDREAQDDLTAEEQDRLRRENEAMESWYGADGDRWGSEARAGEEQQQDINRSRGGQGPRGNPAWGKPGNGYDPYAPVPRGSNRRVDAFAKGKTKAKRKLHKTAAWQNFDQGRSMWRAAKSTKRKAKKRSFWF